MLKSSTLTDEKRDLNKSGVDSGLYSLYKEPPGIDEYVSDVCGLASYQERKKDRLNDTRLLKNKHDQPEFSKSSTSKGFGIIPESRKSSKSVTFTSPENAVFVEQGPSTSDLMVEPQAEKEMENLLIKSISTKVAWSNADVISKDSDLWLAFLIENGLLENSDTSLQCEQQHRDTKIDDPNFIVNQLEHYKELPSESFTTNIRDNYEEIHCNAPGLFFTTVTMDNPDAAFRKMKNLLKNIVNCQKNLKPMIDIDFANLKNYPIIEKKLANICKQIAPQRLFY